MNDIEDKLSEECDKVIKLVGDIFKNEDIKRNIEGIDHHNASVIIFANVIMNLIGCFIYNNIDEDDRENFINRLFEGINMVVSNVERDMKKINDTLN